MESLEKGHGRVGSRKVYLIRADSEMKKKVGEHMEPCISHFEQKRYNTSSHSKVNSSQEKDVGTSMGREAWVRKQIVET